MTTGDTYPWRRHIGADRYLGLRIAPGDRRRGMLSAIVSGVVGLHTWSLVDSRVVATGIGCDGFSDSWWPSADASHVYVLVDDRGDESGHVQRIPVDDAGAGTDLTPTWPPYSVRGGACSADGTTTVFVAVDEAGFHLVEVDERGDVSVRYRSECEAWNPRVSADGRWVSLDTTDHHPGVRRFTVTLFDRTGAVPPMRLSDAATSAATAVGVTTADGEPQVLVDRVSVATGRTSTAVWRPLAESLVEVTVPDVDGETDVRAFDRSDNGHRLLLGLERRAEQRLVVHDLTSGSTTPVVVGQGSHWLPDVRQPSFGPAGLVLATPEDAATPMRVIGWHPDGSTRPAAPTTYAPPGRLARSVSFASPDGTQVQAWLVTPAGAGPHPTVVHAHGGPHWMVCDMVNPEAQAWVERGFAWLDVNYRGSSGRGARFADQIHGDVGGLELEDLAAAHAWLSASGVARPDQVFLSGESYGGFLTLLGMGRQPQLWAAGFATAALADWTLGYADAAPALQAAMRGWFGGTPEQLPDLYRERSPLAWATGVRNPIVVVQGTHDTRTAERQMRAYEAELRRLGKDISVVWLDSGHAATDTSDTGNALDAFLHTATSLLSGGTGLGRVSDRHPHRVVRGRS